MQRASNSAGGQSVVVVLGLWPRKAQWRFSQNNQSFVKFPFSSSGLSFSTSHLLDSQVYDSSGSTVFVFSIKGKFTTTAIYLLLLIHVHPLSSNEAKIRYMGEGVKWSPRVTTRHHPPGDAVSYTLQRLELNCTYRCLWLTDWLGPLYRPRLNPSLRFLKSSSFIIIANLLFFTAIWESGQLLIDLYSDNFRWSSSLLIFQSPIGSPLTRIKKILSK